MRVLITGASGFVGGHLAEVCVSAGDQVVGLSRSGSVPDEAGEGVAIDLRDTLEVRPAVRDASPQVVYHLAALSSVGPSWEHPAATIEDNTATAANVLESLRLEAPDARVVWVSSCQVYGAAERLPVAEDAPLAPDNPYAVSKVSGDLLAAVYAAAHGMSIVRARPFNHSGPRQLPSFIISSLARQAAEGRLAGASSIQLVTGNPDTRRDFTDVRDVVRAYRLLAETTETGVFNVSSGHSVSATELVRMTADAIAPVQVEHVIDQSRVRAHEVMDLSGAHDRLTAATGWEPSIPLTTTITDTIAWWETELSGDMVGSRPRQSPRIR